MSKLLKVVLVKVLRIIGPLFFERKYLAGRWFDDSMTGWKWVLQSIWKQKILGFNRHIKFPCSPNVIIGNQSNLIFHVDNIDNMFSPGCYFQNYRAKIVIGYGSYIAPNVGIITANHILGDLEAHGEAKDVVIGQNCWIGMNAVILPGVELANGTVVGAGAVVTKSVTKENVVVAGNPAKAIREY